MTERFLDAAQVVLSGYDAALSRQWREEDRAWRQQDLEWRETERTFMQAEIRFRQAYIAAAWQGPWASTLHARTAPFVNVPGASVMLVFKSGFQLPPSSDPSACRSLLAICIHQLPFT